MLGIAGLMGAGRTELLECLFGAAAEPPQGKIELLGRDVKFRHPREARAAGIALVTEDRKRLGLFGAMNVGENISICTLRETGAAGFINRHREWQMATGTAHRLAVKSAGLAAPITSLSGGNQQKVVIGKWLNAGSKFFIFDEPTRGIDVGAKAEIYKVMETLVAQGAAVLVISSELPELVAVCDRAYVLRDKTIVGELSRAELTEENILRMAMQHG